ncbi:protein of unknown function; putative FHA domain (plasmid) [Azospirillum lipoferum 4B]|uniref:FHA domain-containing protein n=1 Tax=Azospirillum lipoferum (strain 4B) TaxID=862719 RepID=G7ZGJ8_AZOL4|nr:protein of unknown function; putative FHA domain [Azospirillum lipoferum 4B]
MRAQAIRLGRGAENDITFTNDTVSTYHAALHWQRDGGFMITDLNSSNSTLVNNQEIKQRTLSSGDVIELGEVRMRLVLNQEAKGEMST